jgi:hypothetical protein
VNENGEWLCKECAQYESNRKPATPIEKLEALILSPSKFESKFELTTFDCDSIRYDAIVMKRIEDAVVSPAVRAECEQELRDAERTGYRDARPEKKV